MRAHQAQAEGWRLAGYGHDEQLTTLREATAEIHEAPSPRWGGQTVTLTTSDIGDHLAADRTRCPGCGAPLGRAVEGHADPGWRVEDESGG
jgi:hypothetical protein